MSRSASKNGNIKQEQLSRSQEPFPGFDHPEANFVLTPNQFFEVCLPYQSRPALRLVSYLIRQTLGWLDENGEPLRERVGVSYQELIQHAGISRGSIRKALEQAEKAGFIQRIRKGRAKQCGQSAITAQYALRWDESGSYQDNPHRFKGFYTGEGRRTPIPNQFFDRIARAEPLTVVKVVGTVIRHTAGYQNRYGGRRQQAPLSYRFIQRYAQIKHPTSMTQALHHALDSNYIRCVEPGTFDPQAGHASQAAKYAINYLENYTSERIGSKNRAGSETVDQDRFKKPSGIGSKNRAEDRFKKPSIEIQSRNTYERQQQEGDPSAHEITSNPPAAAVVDEKKLIKKLQDTGFTLEDANELAPQTTPQQVDNQIRWLDRRNPTRSRMGMLRRAIEQDWPEPIGNPAEDSEHPAGDAFARQFYGAYAGNPDYPVAEPSSKDVQIAQQYVDRLHALQPEETPDPTGWGEQFGRFARKCEGDQIRQVVSLVVALRQHGDRFYLQQKQRQQRQAKKARLQDLHVQEDALRPQWQTYLAEQETHIRTEQPEAYAQFEEKRADQRERLRNSRWRYSAKFGDALEIFDTEKSRLEDFQEYFQSKVLDFWAWAETDNRSKEYADHHHHQR